MKKMNEIEKEINITAIKNSWIFGIISLAIYNLYTHYQTGQMDLSFPILVAMMIVYNVSILVGRYKKGDKSSLDYLFLGFIVFLTVLLIGFGVNFL